MEKKIKEFLRIKTPNYIGGHFCAFISLRQIRRPCGRTHGRAGARARQYSYRRRQRVSANDANPTNRITEKKGLFPGGSSSAFRETPPPASSQTRRHLCTRRRCVRPARFSCWSIGDGCVVAEREICVCYFFRGGFSGPFFFLSWFIYTNNIYFNELRTRVW